MLQTVGELNELITGKTNKKSSCRDITDLILVQEALMEKRMAHIADAIAKDPQKKIILIAGPSSSGKTTFSYRLSVQLKAAGLVLTIGVDNYFVDREKSPKMQMEIIIMKILSALMWHNLIRIWKICYKGRQFPCRLTILLQDAANIRAIS